MRWGLGVGVGVGGRGGADPSLLLHLLFVARLHGRRRCRPEAAVASVSAGKLLPDPDHAAAGDDRVGVAGRSPEPPADVLPVGAVTQGRVLVPAARRGQRLAVEQDGLQQGAPQHQRLKQRRRGDADAFTPAAAQLLLWQGGGSAAAAPAPGRRSTCSRRVRRYQFVVGVDLWLQKTEDDLQVTLILLKRRILSVCQ